MATSDPSFFTRCQHAAKGDQEECQEEEYSLCPHCDLWLCFPHNLEHQQITQTNAQALNDHANQVRQQLAEVSIDYLYEHCKKKIDEWQEKMYAEINARHAEMLQQLTKLHNELTDEVKEFKTRKIESFTREIVEPLTHMLTKQKQVHPKRLKTIKTQLQFLEEKIEGIRNPDIIKMNCDAFKLVGKVNFIRKHPWDETKPTIEHCQTLELEVLRQNGTHHFALKTRDTPLAASAHFILVFESPSKLLLFDTKTQLRSIDTEDKSVGDIGWSDTMNLFLIAGKKLQTYDVVSNKLVNVLVDDSQKNHNIWSVTSYLHNILLLHSDGVIEHYLWPSFTRKRSWLSNEYLEKDSDSKASCIRLSNTGMLAMSIGQKDFQWRIDLFDTRLHRTHRGIALTSYNVNDKDCHFPFISLSNQEWLVNNYCSTPRSLLLLDRNGIFKQQADKGGFNLAVMDKEFLVVLDGNGLHLYKLS